MQPSIKEPILLCYLSKIITLFCFYLLTVLTLTQLRKNGHRLKQLEENLDVIPISFFCAMIYDFLYWFSYSTLLHNITPTSVQATNIYLDRGYRGPKLVNGVKIHTPKPDKNITKKRNRHKRRAAIEPVIGHLKNDYRLNRNFLKGIIGDEINVLLSTTAMNFKRDMNLWKQGLNNWAKFLLEITPLIFHTQISKLTFWGSTIYT